MAYVKRVEYSLAGVRIGTAGRKLLSLLGCEVETYVDENDKSPETPHGTLAVKVRFPSGVLIHEPRGNRTASGNKRKGVQAQKGAYGARWRWDDHDCWVKWTSEVRYSGGTIPVQFSQISVDGEMRAGSLLPA